MAHHHAPEQVPPTSFDVLAVMAIAHALAPSRDAEAFSGALPPDAQVDEAYLGTVHAPFTWADATERAASAIAAQAEQSKAG